MLKTYEVEIDNGKLIWLNENPNLTAARAILTILEEKPTVESDRSDSYKAILLGLAGAEPDAQDIPRRRIETLDS